MTEFDYQWKNLPDRNLELTPERIDEFLDYVQLPADWFNQKLCLDAGCGSGRWTWVMMELGAKVVSIDESPEAVRLCSQINHLTQRYSIESFNVMSDYVNLSSWSHYWNWIRHFDFVFCWGVLHHTENPWYNFHTLSKSVRPGGYMHIMVYHRAKQRKYYLLRKLWWVLSISNRKRFCRLLSMLIPIKSEHGWWDALNPRYNHSYYPNEIKKWFIDAGFDDIVLTRQYSINMRGIKL